MPELTEVLQRISIWIAQHEPEKNGKKIPLLAPGLTPKEIENKVSSLPFRLSLELQDLYQWHNGGYTSFLTREEQEFVDKYSGEIKLSRYRQTIKFFSLGEALDTAISIGNHEGKYVLPIFAWENRDDCALLDSEHRETSRIVDLDRPSEKYIKFPSVTDMMLEYAKSLESGSVWIY